MILIKTNLKKFIIKILKNDKIIQENEILTDEEPDAIEFYELNYYAKSNNINTNKIKCKVIPL